MPQQDSEKLGAIAVAGATVAGLAYLLTRKKKAKCPEGYEWSEKWSACIPICPAGYEWDDYVQECVLVKKLPPIFLDIINLAVE